ncbi:MAG: hypothetical protein IJ449_02095 [Clostridia bacterium]|nr:hypothetical protein [Clostridia bacterium]
MRKKIIILFVCLPSLLLNGCSAKDNWDTEETENYAESEVVETEESRVIIGEFGFKDISSLSSPIADINNIEATVELSTQLVLCKVVGLNEVVVTSTNAFAFHYEIEILDILMDVNQNLNIGDIVEISSTEGIIQASKAAELITDDARAKKLGILQNGPYADNEYIRSSQYDAIPIEYGKTYVMFLNDGYLENEGLYAESGLEFLYEYSDSEVYYHRKAEKESRDLEKLLSDLRMNISNRTGRADEIGHSDYIWELGKQQAAARVAENSDN